MKLRGKSQVTKMFQRMAQVFLNKKDKVIGRPLQKEVMNAFT